MNTGIVVYPVPVALHTCGRMIARALRLEHGANAGPLFHVACYLGLLTFTLICPVLASPFLSVPVLILLMLLNYSVTIGVLHMHAHRPLFLDARANRIMDLLCCFPSCVSAAEMHTVHVVNHHRFDDGPGDITSTIGYERGWRAIWYWLRYAYIVRRATVRYLFAPYAWERRRSRRQGFVIDLALVLTTTAALTAAFPVRMLIFYWLPLVVTPLTSGYFAWLTHAPARGFDDGDDGLGSINTVGNFLNFFIFNQGYHSVHHRFPGIHWTEIPDKLRYMLAVEPDLIVPYWVTLHSAWRIAAPDRFRNRRYGLHWQSRLERRLAGGSARSRVLPWFAWI